MVYSSWLLRPSHGFNLISCFCFDLCLNCRRLSFPSFLGEKGNSGGSEASWLYRSLVNFLFFINPSIVSGF